MTSQPLGPRYHLKLDHQLDIAQRSQCTLLVIDTHCAMHNWHAVRLATSRADLLH